MEHVNILTNIEYMKYNFNNITEVFKAILENSFDREFAWKIAAAFVYEEDHEISFNESAFDGLGFIFQFFLVEQREIDDNEFRELVEKWHSLSNPDTINLRAVLYSKELQELKQKLEDEIISVQMYESQKAKYLNT